MQKPTWAAPLSVARSTVEFRNTTHGCCDDSSFPQVQSAAGGARTHLHLKPPAYIPACLREGHGCKEPATRRVLRYHGEQRRAV